MFDAAAVALCETKALFAFVEYTCDCERGGVVRVGPDAVIHGCKWVAEVAFSTKSDHVLFLGFAGYPEGLSVRTRHRVRDTAIREINRLTQLPVEYDRVDGPLRRRMIQISGVHGGKIVMTLKQLPSVSAHHAAVAHNVAGINHSAGVAIARGLIAHAKAGDIKISDVDPPAPGGDKMAFLESLCDQTDAGDLVMLEVESTDRISASHIPQQSVKISYHKKGETKTHSLHVVWHLA